MKFSKIVVTGAGGFLGRHVLSRFADCGLPVWALCGQEHELTRIQHLAENTRVGDIVDPQMVGELLEESEAVVHLAGPPFVHESFKQPMQYAKVHVLGTIAVVQACLKHGVRRLVYVSSAEVYGPGGSEDVHEDQPLQPRSPYGLAKLTAEQFITNLAASSSELTCVVLRPFAVYGSGGHQEALIPTIVRQVQKADCVELINLNPIRDYCHVQEIARAVEMALHCQTPGVVPVNIGSGQGHSVRELAEKALRLAKRDLPILERSNSDRPRQHDVDRLVASVERARTLLDWQPQISIEEGLAELLNERIIEPSSQEPS